MTYVGGSQMGKATSMLKLDVFCCQVAKDVYCDVVVI